MIFKQRKIQGFFRIIKVLQSSKISTKESFFYSIIVMSHFNDVILFSINSIIPQTVRRFLYLAIKISYLCGLRHFSND